MTTFSLLLLALIHSIENGEIEPGDPKLAGKLMRSYLQVREGEEIKFKLKPVKDDQDSYKRLFGSEEHFNEKSKVTANYRYFRGRLANTEYDAETLWTKGISKLEVMQLDLESHDDPQRIFESLNSTGLALKESDKIRNLILMGLPQRKQAEVYENCWNEMEKNVNYWTDGFIRWYLVAQTSKIPKESNVFEEFKTYLKKSNRNPVGVAQELLNFSILMRELDSAETGHKQVDQRLRRANLVLGDVFRPFLWLVYRDLKVGVITAEDFAQVIAIVETYLIRRAISNVPTNALNKIFANLYSELRKLRKHEEDYANLLSYLLIGRGQSGRMPDDTEFSESFRNREVYRMRANYRKYLFESLESANSKDASGIAHQFDNGNLSIEHIMPQTLTKQWRSELGEGAEDIHKTWVNRIGNLTVTGYNSEYSNQPFSQKLKMNTGFLQSPYFLNNYVKKQDSWGLEQIKERSAILTERALQVWPWPETSFEPERENLLFEPMGSDTNFTNRTIAAVELEGVKTPVRACELEGVKTPVRAWRDATIVVLRTLLSINREGVLAAVPTSGSLSYDDVEKTGASLKGWRQVDPALSVYLSTSTENKLSIMRKVCDAAGYDPEDILFYLRAEKPHGIDEVVKPEAVSPYASLVVLKPLVEEVEGASLQINETAEIRESLIEAVAEFPVNDPAAVLGGQDMFTFLSSRGTKEITPEQALACLSALNTTATVMGPGIWNHALLDGTVGKLIGVLESA